MKVVGREESNVAPVSKEKGGVDDSLVINLLQHIFIYMTN